MGVHVQPISHLDYGGILIEMEDSNMDEIMLEKAPKIAVYAPPDNTPYRDPWDDAVKIALDYAQIPYDVIWDKEDENGNLYMERFDWLHLHHEDFTGQHGKFYSAFRGQVWYQQRVRLFERAAAEAGFSRVPRHKGQIAQQIQDYVLRGGFLFAMCSAPETLDIAIAADGGRVDIVAPELDGTPIQPDYQSQLNFQKLSASKTSRCIRARIDTNFLISITRNQSPTRYQA